jgi:hypothetical protein
MVVVDGERWFEDQSLGGKGELFKDLSCWRPLGGFSMQELARYLRTFEEPGLRLREQRARRLLRAAERALQYNL